MISPKIIHRNGDFYVADADDPLEPPVLLAGDTLALGVEILRRHFDIATWSRGLMPRTISRLHLDAAGNFHHVRSKHQPPLRFDLWGSEK